ncbi:MAG: phage head-tail connector protein [Alphaproteobacteria bacterium]|nr:phage head-tail connector protein [Alphaproteobacteria bacterium]
MPLQIITPPALEPVTLAEAKAQLKLDTDADDALISTLITAARARAEWHTGRAFVSQSWILWLDCWQEVVQVPLPPLRAVSSVTTYARDGSATVIDPSSYDVDLPGSRVVLGCIAPPGLRELNALAIAFDAGFGDAASDVPADIRAAILDLMAELYVNRGDAPATECLDAAVLLAPHRVFRL